MRRLILAVLALLSVLALPAAAHAGPVKIGPRASAVSPAGVTTIEAANSSRHVLRGSVTVTVAGRKVASRSVRLGTLSVTSVSLRLDARALDALRAAGGRARITLRVRRAGGRATTARRSLTLRLPSGTQPGPGTPGAPAGSPAPGGPAPGSPPAGTPGTPSTGPGTPPAGTPGTPPAGTPSAPGTPPAGPAGTPSSNTWVGRMGTEGPYDDLELTAAGGQLVFTKPPLVPVLCLENGGAYRSALSFEPFDAPGPWTVGTDGSVAKSAISTNQLVMAGARSITYKVEGTAQEAGRITGKLGMSFFDSRYDIFTNKITFTNCFGSQSFEAVPAG
jgi:hypothetical protein